MYLAPEVYLYHTGRRDYRPDFQSAKDSASETHGQQDCMQAVMHGRSLGAAALTSVSWSNQACMHLYIVVPHSVFHNGTKTSSGGTLHQGSSIGVSHRFLNFARRAAATLSDGQ